MNTVPEELALIAIALAIIAVVALGWFMTRALLSAATHRPAAMITVALSILTLVALLIFSITESETMGTVAATGVGALAGSVTAMFQDRKKDGED